MRDAEDALLSFHLDPQQVREIYLLTAAVAGSMHALFSPVAVGGLAWR